MKRICLLFVLLLPRFVIAQTDATTPLHQLQPNYPVPYGIPKREDVAAVLDRVNAHVVDFDRFALGKMIARAVHVEGDVVVGE